MAEALKPADAGQVLDAVAWAVAEEASLEVVGAGTKRALGRAVQAAHVLDISGLGGIGMYEPAELVMTAGPGTPVAEVEAALAANDQQLGFEPPDLGPLLGAPRGAGTIGGALACNLSGPRRRARWGWPAPRTWRARRRRHRGRTPARCGMSRAPARP